jgi:putative endonuclease
MYVVYILYSENDKGLYVGCTSNLKERIRRHNYGDVEATKHRRPLVCIHTEMFLDKADAYQRERFLKTLWSARFKKKIKEMFLKTRNSPSK